jgi:uncharacterized protein (TIGR02145 family)
MYSELAKKRILAVIIIMIISCVASSCKKDEPPIPLVQVTAQIGSVTQSQMSITAEVPKNAQESGAFLALHENPGFDDTHAQRPAPNGTLNIVFGVEPGTKYYLRAYAKLNGETYFSDVLTATSYAAVLTKNATDVELHQAQVHGQIYLAPRVPVDYWFEWGQSQLNNKTQEKQATGEGPVEVNVVLDNLSWGAEYNYRLAIKDGDRTFYGQQKSFKTLGTSPIICSTEIDISDLDQIHFSAYINSNLLPTNVSLTYGETEHNQSVFNWEAINGDSVRLDFSMPSNRAQIYYFTLRAQNDLGEEAIDTSAVSLAFVYEGHGYKAAKIGNQYWLAENFRGLHYQNGDPIAYIVENDDWHNATTSAICYYQHDENHYHIYGALYNWYAANDPRGIAPPGWRLPTYEDFNDLHNFLSSLDGIGILNGGGPLKAKGLEHWQPNIGVGEDNLGGDWFGFNALGAGARATFSDNPNNHGVFSTFKMFVGFWASSDNGPTANAAALFNDFALFQMAGYYKKHYGFSLRFIKE